jgi:NitT/TauT family transport system ATP-binding protein
MAANPGRIHADVTIDLPFPRTTDTREDPDYLKKVCEVTRTLRSVEVKAS